MATALLYDPLLPIMRKSLRRPSLKRALGRVFGEFFAWAEAAILEPAQFRLAAAHVLNQSVGKHGLMPQQAAYSQSGQLRPESLLFTTFGAAGRIERVE